MSDVTPVDPAVALSDAVEALDRSHSIETLNRAVAAVLATAPDVLAELGRLRLVRDTAMPLKDLAAHVRNGEFNLTAVTGPEGGDPAMRFVAAVMLAACTGDDGELPPNYTHTTLTLRPAVNETDGWNEFTAYIEVVPPGGRTSHQVREDLERQLNAKAALELTATEAGILASLLEADSSDGIGEDRFGLAERLWSYQDTLNRKAQPRD